MAASLKSSTRVSALQKPSQQGFCQLQREGSISVMENSGNRISLNSERQQGNDLSLIFFNIRQIQTRGHSLNNMQCLAWKGLRLGCL
jgi:hypothetical protein